MSFIAERPDVDPLACSAVLTHHWLVRVRGGEKVLEGLAELLPESPIYTLVHDPDGLDESPLRQREVRASWLRFIPGIRRHYPNFLPLMPLAARQMSLPPVDLVVCSDAGIAKAMQPHPRSKLVCYCHSPIRYVWEPVLRQEYARRLPAYKRGPFALATRIVRRADARAARRVDLFVANSRHVAKRIERHYGARPIVVHPPVELPPEPATGPREDFYLCVGYHVPYKRLDLAVNACQRLGRRLVIIGEGPDVAHVQSMGLSNVECLGWQPVDVVLDHYRRARGLLFPGEEDFGIVPVEAMGHGCPVIGYGVGGATETVVHAQTGVLFEEQSVAALVEAIKFSEFIEFDPTELHAHAQQFSRGRFLMNMRTVLAAVVAGEDVSL